MAAPMKVTQINVTRVWDISYIFRKPEEVGGETHTKSVIAPNLMAAIGAVTNLMSAETGFEIVSATHSKTCFPAGFIVVGGND